MLGALLEICGRPVLCFLCSALSIALDLFTLLARKAVKKDRFHQGLQKSFPYLTINTASRIPHLLTTSFYLIYFY